VAVVVVRITCKQVALAVAVVAVAAGREELEPQGLGLAVRAQMVRMVVALRQALVVEVVALQVLA
jgi:hypothetical protein